MDLKIRASGAAKALSWRDDVRVAKSILRLEPDAMMDAAQSYMEGRGRPEALANDDDDDYGVKTKMEGDRLIVYLYGTVGWDFTAAELAKLLDGHDGPATFHCNSPGGLAMSGVAIGNVIRRMKGETTMIVDGMCGSAATVIAVACDRLQFGEATQFLIHEPYFVFFLVLVDIRGAEIFIRDLKKTRGQMAKLYARATGGSEQEMLDVMAEDVVLTAEEAVEMGFGEMLDAPPEAGEEQEERAEKKVDEAYLNGLRYRMLPLVD